MTRRLLAPLLTFLLAAVLIGCEERSSSFIGPTVDPGTASAWTRLYPEQPRLHPTALWALDADDLWVGSEGGWIAHHDGERFTYHRLPVAQRVEAIHGRAWNDVWLVTSGGGLYRWDGRNWTEGPAIDDQIAMDIVCLWVEPGGELVVGGRVGGTGVGAVAHWNGRDWKVRLIEGSTSPVFRLHRPHPESPLVAVASNPARGYWFDGARWRSLDWPDNLRGLAGTLLMTRTDGWPAIETLHRIGPDLTYEPMCEDVDLNGALVDSRWPLVLSDGRALAVIDCTRWPVGDIYEQTSHIEAIVPARPGASSSVIFASTSSGQLARFVWTDDAYLERQLLIGGEAIVVDGPLSGYGDRLHAVRRSDGRLLIGDGRTWQVDGGSPGGIREIVPCSDGSLLCRHGSRLYAVRSADGTWHEFPEMPDYPRNVWLDPTTGTLHAMTEDGALHATCTRGGEWQPTDNLGSFCWTYGAGDAGRHYAIVERPDNQRRIAMREDGVWRDITPDEDAYFNSGYVAPSSNRFVLTFLHGELGQVTAIHDGTSWEFRQEDLPGSRFFETPDQTLYLYDHDDAFLRLDGDQWQTICDLDTDPFDGHAIDSYWIAAGGDIYVLDGFHQIHRLPGAPD